MNWADTPEQARFRQSVRDFVAERFPAEYRAAHEIEQSLEPEDVYGFHWSADRASNDAKRRAAVAAWTDALGERGWVAADWPREYGGAGLGVVEQAIFGEELARAGVPMAGGIGVTMLGPTLIAHGTDDQRRQHLSQILRGEVSWGQGFSEPAAGSDLASLSTRAERDGEHYVINGQKTWTSAGQFADWFCVLVRTDPEQPRHRGLSFLLVDARTPGVTVRPIADMGGAYPFNEVFFDDVRVPVSQRVGEAHRGWYVAMAMLDFERSGIGGAVKHRQYVERIVGAMRSEGACHVRADRTSLRAAVAARYIESEVGHHLALRTVSMQAAGVLPNHEASVNQLFRSELHQRVAGTAINAFGLHGQLWSFDRGPLAAFPAREYVRAVPATLLSGTSEVQRNVIATRGLGLPRG